MAVSELVNIDLLVLPDWVQLLKCLGEDHLNHGGDPTLNTATLSHPGRADSNNLAECMNVILAGDFLSLWIVILCLQHLCKDSIRDLFLSDETSSDTG